MKQVSEFPQKKKDPGQMAESWTSCFSWSSSLMLLRDIHYSLYFYTCTFPENPSLYAYSFFIGTGNTVATWCKELTHWKRSWCWERLKAREEEGDKTEDEMVGLCHWLNGYQFEQTPADREGRRNLVCFSSWGCKELDMT